MSVGTGEFFVRVALSALEFAGAVIIITHIYDRDDLSALLLSVLFADGVRQHVLTTHFRRAHRSVQASPGCKPYDRQHRNARASERTSGGGACEG